MNKPDFTQIVKSNPSGYILRKNLSEKTGGLLHGRTMANLDSLGEGIPGRITFGKRKVAYPVMAVVEYLQSKVTVNHFVEKKEITDAPDYGNEILKINQRNLNT